MQPFQRSRTADSTPASVASRAEGSGICGVKYALRSLQSGLTRVLVWRKLQEHGGMMTELFSWTGGSRGTNVATLSTTGPRDQNHLRTVHQRPTAPPTRIAEDNHPPSWHLHSTSSATETPDASLSLLYHALMKSCELSHRAEGPSVRSDVLTDISDLGAY